jgi:hemoglobin/transferrin/lactoferrin receptor protein
MERIEVIKGPWSALYGSGALGGVIKFERSTAQNLIDRYGPTKMSEFHALIDSNSNTRSIRATAFGRFRALTPLISVRKSSNENLLLSSGQRLDYSSSQDSDVYSSLGVDIGHNQKLLLKANQLKQSSNSPINPSLHDTRPDRLSATSVTKQDFTLDYQNQINPGMDYTFKGYQRVTEIEQKRLSDNRVELRKVTTNGFDTWLNHKSSFFEDSIILTQTLGLEYFEDHNYGSRNMLGTLPSFPNAQSKEYGFYWQPDFKIQKNLKITPGIRFDHFERLPQNSSELQKTRGEMVTRRLYATYERDSEATEMVFLGWGEGFRSPRIQDIYVNGLHFPARPYPPPGFPANFFIPNPQLRAETAETIELGAKKQWLTEDKDRSYLGQFTLFQTHARDFIFQNVQTQQGQTQFINLDRVRLSGYEASFKATYKKWVTTISYGQTLSLNLLTDEPLSDTPANQLNVSAQYLFSDHLQLGFDTRVVEAQTRIPSILINNAVTHPTPGYTVTDFILNYKTFHYGVWLLRGSNIFNRAYKPHGSFIEGPARNISLSWTQSF